MLQLDAESWRGLSRRPRVETVPQPLPTRIAAWCAHLSQSEPDAERMPERAHPADQAIGEVATRSGGRCGPAGLRVIGLGQAVLQPWLGDEPP